MEHDYKESETLLLTMAVTTLDGPHGCACSLDLVTPFMACHTHFLVDIDNVPRPEHPGLPRPLLLT